MEREREDEVICAGCGITIQTEDKEKPGYTPAQALQRDVVICQRCFRLKHYNEVQDVSLTDDDFFKVLQQLGERKGLIVKIVDIFDFDGSWIDGIHRHTGGNPVLLVGNKVDLLPKSVKRSKVIHWMKKEAKDRGLKPVDVHLMSASSGESVQETAEKIDQYRNGKDVYVIGSTNVGKSTFINRLLADFGAENDMMITTSNIPGTTLDMIDVPLDDGSSLFDTPGVMNSHQIVHLLDQKEMKKMTPVKEIKPTVYQLNEGQTIFFGGLGRIDFVQGEHQSFIVYMANDLYLHRTKTEKADELYKQHLGTTLAPPSENNAHLFPDLEKKEWKIPEGKHDVVFSGLGWVTVDGKGAVVRTYVPKGVQVSIRPSIF
ncbi:ribosome biogenesis GTPase YqeH [Salisediminibacterium halotolerans]|uniref:CP-type G domain-containing protein n=1 Tax=Salisediminibacterium halotolerans TaxID=517425 RepID=A0A1H9S406_9BACI|nr:ribosome biogenesis GTPase YqeH [Salisediminibacterium haloalkalitolerans]SER79720.1 hypothetical protein SAMN05444126_10636 [Salisediminibacterium haloalkalitolerans]